MGIDLFGGWIVAAALQRLGNLKQTVKTMKGMEFFILHSLHALHR
jgi:hypothetical protein